MPGLYDGFRRHPTAVDAFWALLLLGCAGVWLVSAGADTSHRVAAVPVVLVLCTVVALRRRQPVWMLLLATAAGLGQLVFDVEPHPADFAMMVIIYTVAYGRVRWASWYALAGGVLAPILAHLRWPRTTNEFVPAGQGVIATFFMILPFVLAWVMGDALRTRRAYWAQLEEKAARLEKERESQFGMAAAAERARIARELHDVVAHNVSVMVVQADGAAQVLKTAPDQAGQALETISGTGRQALAEMRRLLGVLHTGDQAECGLYVPQPGVEQLADLVDQARIAGLPVDFRIEGAERPLPSGVELTAYRIVQEALTNTRQHGGRGAAATVRLGYADDELDVLIEDDGRGARPAPSEADGADGPGPGAGPVPGSGRGRGLIGMRERVGMVRGSLDTGPRPGGGFRVHAVLPLTPPHQGRPDRRRP